MHINFGDPIFYKCAVGNEPSYHNSAASKSDRGTRDNRNVQCTAISADSFQWLFNGVEIPQATNSTLQVLNAQINYNGYYMVIAKNGIGLVPSQMCYLSVVGSSGTVPFSNSTNTGLSALVIDPSSYPTPIASGTAQVVAGPALDQMQPVGSSSPVRNGSFNRSAQSVPTVSPGQTVYYRVNVTYKISSEMRTRQSTVLSLVAGGGSHPVPSGGNLKFPAWPEWPDPWVHIIAPTNQVRIVGESFSFTNLFTGYGDYGIPTFQWRKNGILIGSPQDFQGPNNYASPILSISNAQPSDAGIYDVVVLGNNWFTTHKIVLSIQTTNGSGTFQSPQFQGTNFVYNLLGAVGRIYTIQHSTNLSTWSNFIALSNVTGRLLSPILSLLRERIFSEHYFTLK